MRSLLRCASFGLLMVLVLPTGLRAQTTPDARALRLLGCWTPASLSAIDARPRTCLLPSDSLSSAIELVTLSAAGAMLGPGTLIHTSGDAHPMKADGCRGTERASWSEDDMRLYLRATLQCGAEGVREQFGLITLDRQDLLIIRGVSGGPNGGVQVDALVSDSAGTDSMTMAMRARVARAAALGTSAREIGAEAITVAALSEAITATSAPVVEAWLITQHAPLSVNVTALRAMKRAGLPTRTIDVLVALANPAAFTLRDPNGVPLRSVNETGRVFGRRALAMEQKLVCAAVISAMLDNVNGVQRLQGLAAAGADASTCRYDPTWQREFQQALLFLAQNPANGGWAPYVDGQLAVGPGSLALQRLLRSSGVFASSALNGRSALRNPIYGMGIWGYTPFDIYAWNGLSPWALGYGNGWWGNSWYGNGWNGFGWNPWAGNGWIGGNGPIVITPPDGGGTGGGGSRDGRVIGGRGYSQGGGSNSSPSGSFSGGSGASSSGGSSNSGASGASSGGGYNSGASSSSSGRTAKERP
jgi:hypothetical protein